MGMARSIRNLVLKSGTKKQPKEEVFGTGIPQTFGGHPRGYPGPKLRSGPSKPWENGNFSGVPKRGRSQKQANERKRAQIRAKSAGSSQQKSAKSDFQKLRSDKLWAEFSFPIKSVVDRVSSGKGAGCIQAHPPAGMFYKRTLSFM